MRAEELLELLSVVDAAWESGTRTAMEGRDIAKERIKALRELRRGYISQGAFSALDVLTTAIELTALGHVSTLAADLNHTATYAPEQTGAAANLLKKLAEKSNEALVAVEGFLAPRREAFCRDLHARRAARTLEADGLGN